MPARPLPMDAPVAASAQGGTDGWTVGPGGVWVQTQPTQPQDPVGSVVDQLLRDVIGTLGGQW